MTITIADVMAVVDVLKQFNNEIDDLKVADAIHFATAVAAVQEQAKLAQEFLKTRTLNLIEKQPVVVDGTVYARKPERKWRPNQQMIRSAVVHRAVYDLQTGDRVEGTEEAAANAVSIMTLLFVAPSAMPKQEGLKALGLTNRDVAEHVITGHSLKTIELDPNDDD